jgi:uncharacterized protein with von Willebrand factor type A (vWA) domain
MDQFFKFPFDRLLNALRNDHGARFKIGADSYFLLQKAFLGGYGLENLDKLKAVCCSLFVKNEDQEVAFDVHFKSCGEQYENLLKQEEEKVESEKPEEKPEPDESKEKNENDVEDQEEKEEQESVEEEEPEEERSTTRQAGYVPAPGEESIPNVDINGLSDRPQWHQTDYEPANSRIMQQGFRTLRSKFSKSGLSRELDILATTKQIGREGVLNTLVFETLWRNTTHLVFFIDASNSMRPFHSLVARVLHSTSHLRHVDRYYFSNQPEETVYKSVKLQNPVRGDLVLGSLKPDTLVVFLSDAGAARGGNNYARFERTEKFVSKIAGRTNQFVWLNPYPVHRWYGTTAELIARQSISMFQMDRTHLRNALQCLQS